MKINIQKIRFGKAGFTLFEMMVVLAVVSFVASVTFSSFPKMNNKLSLDLLAQDVALTVRQAQVYGTTVFGVGEIKAGNIAANYQAYGVSFPSIGTVNSDGKYTYTLFADVPLSSASGVPEPDTATNPASTKSRYDETPKDSTVNTICMNGGYSNICLMAECGNPINSPYRNECLQRFLVSGRDEISAICLNYFNAGNNKDERVDACEKIIYENRTCITDGLTLPDKDSSVDIVFRRPKLQAVITTKNSKCTSTNGYYSPGNVGIILKSNSGETRAVVIWKNGQVSIDK